MPHCQNCGTHVTASYVRVFAPSDEKSARVCPHCDDLIRDGSDVRAARSTRRS